MKAPQVDSNRALVRPDENRDMFDMVAGDYDLMNGIMSLGRDGRWREIAVDMLAPKSGGFYVDAGCGTADVAIEIARRFPAGSVKVSGIDRSEGMLAFGRRKVGTHGLDVSVTLSAGDALALPLGNDSADGLISAFVFRNLDDRAKALAEWRRVLKPGASCVVMELSTPENPLFRLGYRVFTKIFVLLASAFLSKQKAYRYLLSSISAFPNVDVIERMFTAAGFRDFRTRALMFGAVRIFRGVK